MRQIASVQKTLDGIGTVTVTPFGARTALRLTTRLGRHVLPALEGAKGLDLESELTALAAPLQRLAETLDDEAFDWLILNILRGTTLVVDGRMSTLDSDEKIDAAFGADMVALLRVCAYALEVNYGGFIELLRAVVGKAQQAKAARAAAPASDSSLTTT